MLINIITLKDKLDNDVENALDQLTTDYSIFPANNGDAISIDKYFITNISRSIYGRDLRRGEIGCTISHHLLIKKFSMSADEWSVVCEDDALVTKEIDRILICIEKIKIDQPTVLLLGHSKTIPDNMVFQRLKHPLGNKIVLCDYEFGMNKWVSGCGVGTLSYVINRSAAEILSQHVKAYWVADDWKLIQNMGINVYHPIYPFVWEKLSSSSTTGNSNRPHHNLFSSRFFREVAEVIYSRLRLFFYNDYE